jgi:hypothetical protein
MAGQMPAGDPGEARIAGRASYVCGVADGAVVLGALDPPEPFEPEPEPPMFGQSPFIPPA